MKDFLAISDGGSEDEPRFVCAEALASRFNGYITVAVVTELPPLQIAAVDPGISVPFDDVERDAALARGAELKSKVERRFQQHSPSVNVSGVAETPELLDQAVGKIARTHDLCITTLPTGKHDSKLCNLILDGILIGGGRGLLGLPPGSKCNATFERVAIAWNGSRECSRAVSQAMPFIKKAREVSVVLVDPPLRKAGEDFRPGDDIISHLKCHDISASLARVSRGELHTSEAILAEVTRSKAELLVMGAQAKGGILQWFQGTTSREVFAAAPIPLLMAH
jgi:nucleotide-binding universal stress UspA family protein